MITVRAAVPGDAEFLTNLSANADGFRRGIERPDRTIVVAELDGEVVGYALAVPSDEEDAPRDWCLAHIYQYSRAHGSGTGQALLDAAVGGRPAYLWTAEDNPRALAFYRRNGFAPDGARKLIPEWEHMPAIRMVR